LSPFPATKENPGRARLLGRRVRINL